MADAAQRNLPASARKLSRARRDGQVARSRDLAHLAAIGVGGALLLAYMPVLVGWMQRLLSSGLRFDQRSLHGGGPMLQHLLSQGIELLWIVLPLGGLLLLAAVAAGLLAGGWNFTWKPLAPKFDKLNPLTGIARLFSPMQLVETLKACLLAAVLLVIGALYLRGNWAVFGALSLAPLPGALAGAGELLGGVLTLLLVALGVFALLDVPLQKWRLSNQLKMSIEEVKQEVKEVEGNVEVKGRIRARMRAMSRRRMLAAVPQADLVVMNPTHYAVALKYDEATMAAPKVIAKGSDRLAFKIRDLAAEHQVPVLQAPPLARALFAHCEIDQEVPTALFGAVAQVLAWVYQLRSAVGSRAPVQPAPMPSVPPELDPLNPSSSGGPRARRRRSAA